LQQEADQRHQLQHSLADLQRIYNNELTLRHNAELALSAAHGQIKEKEKASYDLLAEIHHLTSQQDALASTQATLQQENKRLLLRIEELKVNNEHLGRSVNAPKPQANPVDDRVALMQHQLSALQEAHRQQTNELRSTAERLQRAQALHNQATNELAATQRRHQTELDRIQGDAGEKEQELIDLRNHAESAYEHEQQLLRRIEEEESKAESLELMLRKQSDELRSKENADKALKAAERKADVELRRAEELEQQITRLHDDIQSARSSAEAEQARTQELTDRYTQLEQTHRGAQQEKRLVGRTMMLGD
jgi:chromosome segregation ATPase